MKLNSIFRSGAILVLLIVGLSTAAYSRDNEIKIKGTLSFRCEKSEVVGEGENAIHKCDPNAPHNTVVILTEEKTGAVYVLEPDEKQGKRVRLLNMGMEHASMMAQMHLAVIEYFTGIKMPETGGLKFKTSFGYISPEMSGSKAEVKGALRKDGDVSTILVKKIEIEGASHSGHGSAHAEHAAEGGHNCNCGGNCAHTD